jgi:hypothetical protein
MKRVKQIVDIKGLLPLINSQFLVSKLLPFVAAGMNLSVPIALLPLYRLD